MLPFRLHGDRDETPVAGLGVAERDPEGAPRTPTAIFEHEEPPAQEPVSRGVEHARARRGSRAGAGAGAVGARVTQCHRPPWKRGG